MVSISSFISDGYTNPVIWRLYEAGTGVFVDDHQELGPHGQVYNFSWVNNIKDIVYRIDLYDQPGGTGIGNLIKSHNVTVSTSTLTFDADIETVVNGGTAVDPVSGENTSPVIPALVGKDYYVVQRGIGQLLVTRNIEIIINDDGSYTLAGDNKFNDLDTLILKIRPQYVVNPPGSQIGSSLYKDILLITGDTVLASTDWGKLLIVDGVAPVVTITFPTIASIIEKISLWIESVGTSHINVVLKGATGETITATGTTSNTFILSRACKAEVLKLGSTLYGFTDDNDIKCRGQIEWGYSVGLNRLWADGSEYLVSDYPGLKKAMDLMETGTVVTYTQWNSSVVVDGDTVFPYKGFFALSPDSSHFMVPDLRNKFIRGLNGVGTDSERLTQGAGGYGHQAIKLHNHTIATTNSGASSGDDWDPIRGSLTGAPNTRGGLGAAKTIGEFGGAETRPINIGLIPLIIL